MSDLIKIISPDFLNENERGKLVQLVHEGYSQVNVVTSQANTVRGGHYHKISNEAFYIVCGELDIELEKEEFKEKYSFKTGDFFVIRPYVSHTLRFITDCIMIGLYDVPVEKSSGEMDIYRMG